MEKKFIKVPKGGKDMAIFCLQLAKGLSGKDVTKEEIIDIFKKEDVKLTDEVKLEIEEMFPEVVFDN